MTASILNFSNSTPAAPSGAQNVEWQNDGGASTANESAYVPLATDSVFGLVKPDGSTITVDAGVISAPPVAPTLVALAPSAPGNFTVAHGLGTTPAAVVASMTSGGQIWLQSPTGYDATNLYLVASDAGVTGHAVCFI